MSFPRASSVLCIRSLPGPFGIGDLGDEAHAFVDFLASTTSLWQVLPLRPTGFGDSLVNASPRSQDPLR
jgi:4-alpha-glucanotransferase